MTYKYYFSLNDYFKSKYSNRIQKITVSLPFTCPHIEDGSGGCAYCHKGSMPPGADVSIPLAKQIMHGIISGKKRYGDGTGFIVYYQTYTNTNAPLDKLKEIYDEAFNHPDIIGIDVGTRPDCAGDDVLKLLKSYEKDGAEVWLELGLQSANNKTLAEINRRHTVEDFTDAAVRSKKAGLKIIAHMMVGLPGETHTDFMATAKLIASLGFFGIKIHPLYVMEGTALGDRYAKKPFEILKIDEYVKALADIIEVLPQEMVVMRFTAEGGEKQLIAPNYCRPEYKLKIKDMLLQELMNRGTKQGSKYI